MPVPVCKGHTLVGPDNSIVETSFFASCQKANSRRDYREAMSDDALVVLAIKLVSAVIQRRASGQRSAGYFAALRCFAR